MKLYQAIKEKKRLIREIAELNIRIQQNNSILKGNERDYDVEETFEKYLQLKDKLVDLKNKIRSATAPVYPKLHEMEETKDIIQMLKNLDCSSGISTRRRSYMDTDEELITYESQFDKKEVDDMISSYVSKVSRLQDEIDEFNYTTEVDV